MKREYTFFLVLLVATAITTAIWFFFPEQMTYRIFLSVLAVTVIYCIFSLLLDTVFRKKISDTKSRYTATKVISVLEILLMAIIVARIWVEDVSTLVVFFGIIGAGVAIALQDVFKNFAGSITILLSGTYSVGDRIEIDGRYGDVMDIGIMNTTMMELRSWVDGDQATGRLTIVPNGKVITSPVNNYTKDHSFIWDEIQVPVTYRSDWRRAIEIITTIAKTETAEINRLANREIEEIGEKYYLPRRDIEPAVYVRITDNWIMLSVRYVTNARERRIMHARLSRLILEALEKEATIEVSSTTMEVSVIQKRVEPEEGSG
ncbi:MAG: mechanosensitive ion channel [Methanomicrobiales archaeon]|nr:mechanosensitive ion channel [Methanomicrobiales archaeon]